MVAPLTPDGARLAAIREALPALGAGIYLNTAAAGPLPAETARVMAEEASRELTMGRAHPADAEETLERVAEARAAMAAVLAADLDEVALTRGTAHGLELACAAVDWSKADRAVLVTDVGGTGSWPVQQLRSLGVEVKEIPSDGDADAVLDAIEVAVRGGAKLVGLPHVSETTGWLLPVKRLSGIAHRGGAMSVLDASASIGAIDLDLAQLDADIVAFPSERWLLGPVGLGGLWCRRQLVERMVELHPEGFGDPAGDQADEGPAGRAPSLGLPQWHRPSTIGFARSCGLLSMQIGLPWAWERTASLASRAVAGLRAITGVEVLNHADPDGITAILTFRIRGWDARAALEELGARVFAIAGLVSALNAIRMSLGAWNTEEELDRFLEGVALLAAHTPATLPPRRTLNVLP